MSNIKVAILDLYDNTPNQGMRCINQIVDSFREVAVKKIYCIRDKVEVPDLNYDIYISSGGPGSPLDGDGVWDKKYFDWLQSVWEWNRKNSQKKFVIFICHSFQMACRYFRIGKVTQRKSPSFGIYPVYPTDLGVDDPLFEGLNNPFWAADFRSWQVVSPDIERLDEIGAGILALEKVRPHVPLERAIMGIRFSEEIVGVQFHPEADPDGMLTHFKDPERRKVILEKHSERKYDNMMEHLYDSDRLKRTQDVVIPGFLSSAIEQIKQYPRGRSGAAG